MKIAVIGAGVAGICTAYELALDGHAVSVFERHAAVAEEASYACGGLLASSLCHPLAWPTWPQSSGWRTWMQSSGITLGRGSALADLRWLNRWKRAPHDFRERFTAAQQLAQYSQTLRQGQMLKNGIVCEQSTGLLLPLGSAREEAAWQERLSTLRSMGVAVQLLSADAARQIEPALGADLPLHAALHFPQDEVANCRQFAHALREKAIALGVAFHFNTAVTGISHGTPIALHTAQGTLDCERLVLCAGTGATPLLGASSPAALLRPVWSCSLSAQVREPLNAPRSAVLASHGSVAISRLGQRIRVSGGAQLGGPLRSGQKAAQSRLYRALQSHFPGAADFSRSVQFWQGASVFSADALPLVGPAEQAGVWLNLAHGHNGWSMASGAARVLADQIAGRSSDIDTSRLHPARFKPG